MDLKALQIPQQFINSSITYEECGPRYGLYIECFMILYADKCQQGHSTYFS